MKGGESPEHFSNRPVKSCGIILENWVHQHISVHDFGTVVVGFYHVFGIDMSNSYFKKLPL